MALRSLRSRFVAGEVLIGTFCNLGSALAVEACAAAGASWVLIDTEHGAAGDSEVAAAVTAAAGYGVPTLVRTESAERIRIGRMLDFGVAGVMVPRIESAHEAEQFVAHLRYPPLGDRGVATYNRQSAFGLDVAALDEANRNVAGIVQIETLGGLAEADKIAAIDGVDALFVGPMDLSYALGVPRDFTHQDYQAALDAVLGACREHGKSAGILVNTADAAQHMVDRGFGFVALGSDSTLLAAHLHGAIVQLDGSMPRR
jgi:2-dehydro-3-deoxyglucarate aldolase/4-hydroxy-2-oxoheptanedioate aldolase